MLRLEWDPPRNGFRFTENPGKASEESTFLTYATADKLPPAYDFKNIKVRNMPAHCTAGRKRVMTDVLLDNVKVNPAALP